ncbi:MAG: alpha/beta hydrolase family protein [Candidatus Muiribacteriaceae bacterium]
MYRGDTRTASKQGTIFLYHGVTSCKEEVLPELKLIAEAGYLAIGVDNVGHGERSEDIFSKDVFDKSRPECVEAMTKAVEKTAVELRNIINGLHFLGITQGDKFGVIGISMGAYITYAALIREKRIRVACPVIGSPVIAENEYSPHNNPDKIYPRPLLIQNSKDDTVVPVDATRDFLEKLKTTYADRADLIKYIEYKGEDHFFTENAWNDVWKNVITFLDSYFLEEEIGSMDAYTDITEKYRKGQNRTE